MDRFTGLLGILAVLAVPKYQDVVTSANAAATKGGLGAVRSTLAIRYGSSATGGAAASFPTSLAATDFGNSELPRNSLSTFSGVTGLSATVNGTVTHVSAGSWYISGTTSSVDYGKAGAYSDGAVNTANY